MPNSLWVGLREIILFSGEMRKYIHRTINTVPREETCRGQAVHRAVPIAQPAKRCHP